MQKPIKTLSHISFGAVFLFASNAAATVYTIEDSWINWPGYSSSYNAQDELNDPQIDKMLVTVENNFLTKIDVVLRADTRVLFDSLFINTSWDSNDGSSWDNWNYFVHDGGTSNTGHAAGAVPGNGLFEVGSSYAYTTVASGGRNGNPNGIDAGYLFNRVDFTPTFDTSYTTAADGYESIISYDFGTGFSLDKGFFVAYSPYCANDVLGGGAAPVPEPATMLLFGAGLTGLAGYRLRSKKK